MAKLNVDMAVTERLGVDAIATIARDSEGVFLGASTIGFRAIMNLTTLEAMALSEDLQL